MARELAKVMLMLAAVTGTAVTLQGAEPDPVPADEPVAGTVVTVEEVESQSEVDVEELQRTIQSQASEITTLKLDLANEKLGSRKLSEENAEMRKVLERAMPLMEQNIQDWHTLVDTTFAMVDYAKLKGLADEWQVFAPYSEKYDGVLADVGQFMQIADSFRKYAEFDTEPYSEATAKSTLDGIMKLALEGSDILLPVHTAEIDALYEKVEGYSDAVRAFDGLIKSVDAKLGPNRDNPSADKLCRIDYDSVILENTGVIEQIKPYRYLAELLLEYTEEIEKQPRSLTKMVRDRIDAMLKGSATTSTATTEDKE